VRRLFLAASLVIAANAFAVRLEVAPETALTPVDSPRQAEALRNAIGVFRLPDRSLWVTRLKPSALDPSAMPVTRFAADSSVKEFFLSEWLPKGTLANDHGGQVRAVTQLDDGRVVVSGGWNDGKASYNAVFILRARDDGHYETEKVIRMPGVSGIAAIGGNSIVAVTDDAMRRGPLLTLVNTEGQRRGILASDPAMSAIAAAQNASSGRLQRVGESSIAFYNPSEQKIYLIELNASSKDDVVAEKRVVSIGGDAALASLRVVGIDIAKDGDVIVARVGPLDGAFGTHLTIYGADDKVKKTVTVDRPWNHMLREEGRLQGVVPGRPGRDISFDTVRLASE
jgi:hypothetical protein